jgi:hypothetical protein
LVVDVEKNVDIVFRSTRWSRPTDHCQDEAIYRLTLSLEGRFQICRWYGVFVSNYKLSAKRKTKKSNNQSLMHIAGANEQKKEKGEASCASAY